MQELRIEQRSESEINEELTKLLIQRSKLTEEISTVQRDNKQLVDQVNVLHRKYEKINEEKENKAHEMRKYIESIKLKLDKTENDKIQELLKEQELLKVTKKNLANEFINIQENWGNENEEMKSIYKETEINRKILKEKLTTIAKEKQLLDKEKAELERYRNRLNDEKKIIINNQLTLQLHRSFTQELPDNFSVLATRVKQVVSEAADRIIRLKSAKSEEEKDLILFQSFSPPENQSLFHQISSLLSTISPLRSLGSSADFTSCGKITRFSKQFYPSD
jgi:chromosome segregation ATPase